jgi:hypothetical protein
LFANATLLLLFSFSETFLCFCKHALNQFIMFTNCKTMAIV